MSEKTEDNFERGIFWGLYKDLERQFQDFLEYVPYLPGNETVYSFKLVNLILSIGGHVDSIFKEMARYPKFSDNTECREILGKLKETEGRKEEGKGPITVPISLPLKAFEKEYKLSEKKVIFKRISEKLEIIPFTPYNPTTNSPEWWEIYNGLKHDVGINVEEASLKTTLTALAGAFLLNAVHIPSVLRLFKHNIFKIEFEPEVMGGDYSRQIATLDWVRQQYERTLTLPTMLETPLFIFDYDGWDEYYE